MGTFSSKGLLNRFHDYARRRRLFDDRSKIIVAVSGGIDSSVLLDLFVKERDTSGLSLIVAHFNYQLRGPESDGDEQHVKHRASSYGLEFYVERANTTEYARHMKLGIQEAARNLRYEFFDKLLLSSGFDRVATAHNADDNAETMLLNLFRGAGVQGLAGIPVFRPDRKIIRPLLFAPRQEIEQYAQLERISYRNDSSNSTDHYSRNYIRHHVMPLVKSQINPNLLQTLHRTAELFRELEAYLGYNARHSMDLVTTSKTADEMHLSIPRLRSAPVLVQQYVIIMAVDQFTRKKLDYDQVASIMNLAEGITGSWVSLASDAVVYRDRDELVLRRTEPVNEFKITILPNHRYEFSRFRFASQVVPQSEVPNGEQENAEYVDADRIHTPDLVLRTWSEGDAFVPLGMNMKKKISDFFIDAKVPIYEKHNFPILETKEGEIVWVCGQRIDDRFKITDQTKRVLKLEFSRLPRHPDAPDTQS
jgi:tRNA(Ile)-lysidine synthase